MSQTPRYTPEGALARIEFEGALKTLLYQSSSSRVISAEEVIDLVQETLLYAKSTFGLEIDDFRSVNPTIRVGETNVSSDKTVAGTVESSRYFTKQPRPLDDFIRQKIKEKFEKMYLELDVVRQTIVQKDSRLLTTIEGLPVSHDSYRARQDLRRANRKNRDLSAYIRKLKAQKSPKAQNKKQNTRNPKKTTRSSGH
jgi:hypothetical protein